MIYLALQSAWCEFRKAAEGLFSQESYPARDRWHAILFMFIHMACLIMLGFVAFSLNASYLLNGLDGSYLKVMARQQFLWGGMDLGYTNNFFQSLGNIKDHVNTNVIPGYLLSLYLNAGELDPVISYVIFSLELFASTYLICLVLRVCHVVAALAAWGLVVSGLPYFGLPWIYPITGLSPHYSTVIAVTAGMLIIFRILGRGGFVVNVFCVAGIMAFCSFLLVAKATGVVLVVPPLVIFGMCILMSAEGKRELLYKLGGAALIAIALLTLGPTEFLLGLLKYTAAHDFPAELSGGRQDWMYASIAFHRPAFGVGGPLLFWLGLAGGSVTLLLGDKFVRRVTVGFLVSVMLVVLSGVLTVRTGNWPGPSPVNFEIIIWPFYATYAAVFIFLFLSLCRAYISNSRSPWLAHPRTLLQTMPARTYCFGIAGVPWLLLLASQVHMAADAPEQSFPYPPRMTPIVAILRNEIGLSPGEPFRGRVATFTGEGITGPIGWLELHALDHEYVKRFGNDHRTVGLWYYFIPTLFEYSTLITPAFYSVVKNFLALPEDRQMRSVIVMRRINERILGMMGVRFLITDASIEKGHRLRSAFPANGGAQLYLYELDKVNLGNFSPTEIIRVSEAKEALAVMLKSDFDPSQLVVVNISMPDGLVPATSSRLYVDRIGLRISAESRGRSLLLLPVEYSHCLELRQAVNSSASPRLIRANLLQTGVLFDRELDATLMFFTGPFHNSRCRLEDAEDASRLHFVSARS
ncbi:MAG: hypothetical protein ABIN58_05015 [candidate division WOR-3 bacterium]